MTGRPAIREERAGDEAVIRHLTEAAFAAHPYSDGSEPAIVDRLRTDGDLALSLVADAGIDGIVGHVAFSPVALSGGQPGWYALGPISVAPEWQRRGVGSALIADGTLRLRESGAKGIVLVGDPKYYGRFGFIRGTPLHTAGAFAEYFQVLPFGEDIPQASVQFARAFSLESAA